MLFTIHQVRSAVATLKNSVIGSQRQKNNIVEHGVIARLIHLLVDPDMNSKIKTDVVYILGSIINGSETNLKSLNEADLANILLQVSPGHSLNNLMCNLCLAGSLVSGWQVDVSLSLVSPVDVQIPDPAV